MKKLKSKPDAIDFSWLPPAEEWDFRSVTEAECRVACHWEYSRDIYRHRPRVRTTRLIPDANGNFDNPPEGELDKPQNYHGAAKEYFPTAWTRLTEDQRKQVEESFPKIPVIQVRTMGEFLKRMPQKGGIPEISESIRKYSYVIQPYFTFYSKKAIIKELKKWAQTEAMKFPPSRRGKAAALPFDLLKMLAVKRVENERLKQPKKKRVSVKKTRDILSAYQDRNRKLDYGVFPKYESNGAWTNALNGALKRLSNFDKYSSLIFAE